MVIGEWPSKEDSRSGRPFSGKIGGELTRFLSGVGVPARDDCYLTLWIKQWCGPDADYTASDFVEYESRLVDEIRTVQPRLVLCLGRSIVRYFLGDVDLDETFAIPWRLPQFSPRRELFVSPEAVVIFAAYSPGAGMRSPEISARIAYQFAQLESVVDGTLIARHLYDDPIPNPTYTLLKGDEVCRVLLDLY